jgi:hypothetical protein
MAEKQNVPNQFTYDEIEKLFFEFEKLLQNRSKTVPPGSNLEKAGLTAIEVLATYKKEIIHDYKKDCRNEWRRVLSMADILRKIISLQKYPAFDSLWPHILLLLGNGEIAQNLWSRKEDSHANYVFELYVALLTLPLCTSIDVEPPIASAGGTNPDIIAAVDGVRWGIACKAMHSSLAKSMLDRVRDGIRQINRCDGIENGLIVVSLKNIIPHDLTWPVIKEPNSDDLIYLTASSDKIVIGMLLEECKRYEIELLELLGGKEGFRALFEGTKVAPLILVHLCTATSLLREGKPTFTLIKMLVAINVDPLSKKEGIFAKAMNEVLHDKYLVS